MFLYEILVERARDGGREGRKKYDVIYCLRGLMVEDRVLKRFESVRQEPPRRGMIHN